MSGTKHQWNTSPAEPRQPLFENTCANLSTDIHRAQSPVNCSRFPAGWPARCLVCGTSLPCVRPLLVSFIPPGIFSSYGARRNERDLALFASSSWATMSLTLSPGALEEVSRTIDSLLERPERLFAGDDAKNVAAFARDSAKLFFDAAQSRCPPSASCGVRTGAGASKLFHSFSSVIMMLVEIVFVCRCSCFPSAHFVQQTTKATGATWSHPPLRPNWS